MIIFGEIITVLYNYILLFFVCIEILSFTVVYKKKQVQYLNQIKNI